MLSCCPACRTCFRVTDAQLAVAQGKVRCGKCKTVFNAKQHLRTPDQEPSRPRSEPTITPTPPTAEQSATARSEEIGHIDLQATPEPLEPDRESEEDITTALEQPQEFRQPAPEPETEEDEDTTALEQPEEFRQTAPEPETEEDEEITTSIEQPEAFRETEAEVDAESGESESRYKYNDFTDEMTSDKDLDEILAEMNHQLSLGIDSPAPDIPEPVELPVPPRSRPEHENDDLSEAIDHLFDDIQMEEESDQQVAEEEPLDSSELQGSPEPEFEQAAADETEQLSEELDFVDEKTAADETSGTEQEFDEVPFRLRDSLDVAPPKRRGWLATLGGALLILLLLVGLLFQLTLFRPLDVVQLIPTSQPYIQLLCEQLPCEFHYRQELDQIQLMNRDVRAHPKQEDALLITATIINKAEFKQPYPGLLISLFDLSGNVVAQRHFVPADYMGDLDSPFLLMTPDTPVQITLEVKDPGNAAINFEFDFK